MMNVKTAAKNPSKLALSKETVKMISVQTGVRAGTGCSMQADCGYKSAAVNLKMETICMLAVDGGGSGS